MFGLHSRHGSERFCWMCCRDLRTALRATSEEIEDLSKKPGLAELHPQITVGVYGGQVQWTLGNPFPIRVCDYDGEKEDLPDIDERGQRCRMWYEPGDARMEQD